MIALDTNLLVYAHRADAAEHSRAIAVLDRARSDPEGWGVAAPVLAEFWRVVTSPANPQPATPAEAGGFLRQVFEMGALLWLPTDGHGERLVAAAVAGDIRGNRVYDLEIAMIARAAGAEELWTHDAAFIRIPGLRIFDPLI